MDTIIVVEKGEVIFNHTIDEIQQNLSFKKIKNLDETDDLLYSEKEFGGYSALIKNSGNEFTKIDIETLYKAINTNKKIVNNAFNE